MTKVAFVLQIQQPFMITRIAIAAILRRIVVSNAVNTGSSLRLSNAEVQRTCSS